MGSISLNGVTALTESSGIVQFSSGIKHPVGHIVQTASQIYNFTGDLQITDAPGTGRIFGPVVQMTLINANAKVLFRVDLSEINQANGVTCYFYLTGGTTQMIMTGSSTNSAGTHAGAHSNAFIVPSPAVVGQNAGSQYFSILKKASSESPGFTYGGVGQCSNSAGDVFYFAPSARGSGSTTYVNSDGSNGFCTLIVQEIQV